MKMHLFQTPPEIQEGLQLFIEFYQMPYGLTDFQNAALVDSTDGDVLVVCNCDPERLDGVQKLQKIRSLPELSATPIIFLSENLSEHASILYQDLDLIFRSELPFQSGHFFSTIEKVQAFVLNNQDVLNGIRQIHEDISVKKFKSAFQTLNRIAKQYPSEFRLNLLFGRLYLEGSNFEKAMHFTKRSLHLSPKSLEANNLLASIYFKMGDKTAYRQAIDHTTKMAEIILQNLIHWGDIYLEKGNSKKSITAYEAALEKDPNNLAVKQGLLAAQLIEGRSSITESREFAENQSMELARLFNLKGISMAEAGNYPAAERLYKNAINLLPYENLEHKLWLNLGLCMKKKGNLQRAAEYFEKSDRCAPPEYNRAQSQLKAVEQQIQSDQERSVNFANEMRISQKGDTLNYAKMKEKKSHSKTG